MGNDAKTAEVEVADAFALLIKEEIVQAPDRAFFAIEGVFFGSVAVDGAFFQLHLLVDDLPHLRTPCLASAWRAGRHVGCCALLRAEVVKCSVDGRDHGTNATLAMKVRWPQDV